MFETIASNTAGQSRLITQGGRQYLVAPMSLIKPGVLPGSKGPLLYEAKDCAANAKAWDGMPLVVYHPVDPLTGRHISASSPGVFDRSGIGYARNTRFGKKLVSMGYFDLERVQNIDKQLPEGAKLYDRLMRGEKIELSTGLYTSNEEAEGVHSDGRPYSGIARNYKPDHIAILPDQKGACSIADGCGVHNQVSADPQCPT